MELPFPAILTVLSILMWFSAALTAQDAPIVPRILRDLTPAQEAQAEHWLRSLALRRKIAQLMVVSWYGEFPEIGSKEERRIRELVESEGIGGLIVLNRVTDGVVSRAHPYEMAAFLNRMQGFASVPLLVAGDFERGPSMRVEGPTVFPHAMAFGAAGDPELTRRFGEITAAEARALGVHWVLAPSADVNSDPSNPVIQLRSFGENPQEVSEHVVAFVRGAQENPEHPVLASVKHFPGHGDTSVDSHFGLPLITRTKEQLDAVELPPFAAAVRAGVASVMPGHLSVPALDASGVPATVSKDIITGYLRGQLHFGGIVATDGLDMAGLTAKYSVSQAPVLALAAGVDALVIPPDPKAAIDAVEAAVASGLITEARIDESVRRLLRAKARLGLAEQKLVSLEQIARVMPSASSQAVALEVARKAITGLRNRNRTLPLRASDLPCAVILNRSRFSNDGRVFARTFERLAPGSRVSFVDNTWSAAATGQLQRDLARCKSVSIASFVSIGGFPKGAIPLPPAQAALVKAVEASASRLVLIGFTNPYLASYFPGASAVVTPFSSVATSERAAAEALFGVFPMTGRTPVSIPGVAEAGMGGERGQ